MSDMDGIRPVRCLVNWIINHEDGAVSNVTREQMREGGETHRVDILGMIGKSRVDVSVSHGDSEALADLFELANDAAADGKVGVGITTDAEVSSDE